MIVDEREVENREMVEFGLNWSVKRIVLDLCMMVFLMMDVAIGDEMGVFCVCCEMEKESGNGVCGSNKECMYIQIVNKIVCFDK